MILKLNGNLFLPDPSTGVVPELLRKWSKEQSTDIIMGTLDAVRDIVVDLSYSISLVGTGLCVLFWVVGWHKGKQWAGVLFLAHVIVKLLLGGA